MVHDLDIPCVADSPREEQAPSIVDADAVLAGSVTDQRFQTIGRRGGVTPAWIHGCGNDLIGEGASSGCCEFQGIRSV
jgi:hypothetical protein